jgi:hypothetical protein
MKDIINRIAELRKNIETAKTTDVIEISVELIRIESLLKQLSIHDVSQQSELLLQCYKEGFQTAVDSLVSANEAVKNKTL